MREDLLAAVTDSRRWLPRFTKFEYRRAFGEYMELYGPLWREAVTQAEEPEALASELLDALAAHIARQRFWNRSVTRIDCRQMTVVYLSPMLLKLGYTEFADLLSRLWAKRWPDLTYGIASYETLLDGFVDVILGIQLPKKRSN